MLAAKDNERLRSLLIRWPHDLGYRVCEAGNARTAIETLGRDPGIDLLLTDVVLAGGINGRELARKVAVLRPGLKVLFTFGFPENRLRQRRGASARLGASEQALPR